MASPDWFYAQDKSPEAKAQRRAEKLHGGGGMPGHILHLASLMEEQVRTATPCNRRPAAAADTSAPPAAPRAVREGAR